MNVFETRQEHSRDISNPLLPKKINSDTHEINIYDHSADSAVRVPVIHPFQYKSFNETSTDHHTTQNRHWASPDTHYSHLQQLDVSKGAGHSTFSTQKF